MAAPLAMSLSAAHAMIHPALKMHAPNFQMLASPRSGVLRMEEPPTTYAEYMAQEKANPKAASDGSAPTRDSSPTAVFAPSKSSGPSGDKLAAIFASFDLDSDGAIDRQELGMALSLVSSATPSEAQVDDWFVQFCSPDRTVDVESFKQIVGHVDGTYVGTEVPSAPSSPLNFGWVQEGGAAAVSALGEGGSDRRQVLQLAAVAAAALALSKGGGPVLQAGQKAVRPLLTEPLADAAQMKMFPTALLSSDMEAAVYGTLSGRGFSPANTLFSHSVCSDEVNGKEEELVDLMMDRWGEGFSLGGLAGLPFAGKSGFRAYLHHVPDKGKLLIMFAPHVGIDKDGRIGALQRDGQDAVSKACGAAIGAFKAIKAAQAAPPADKSSVLSIPDPYEDFDPQIQQIVGLLKPRMEGLEDSANDIGFVTYQMYGIVRDLIDSCIRTTPDVWEWTDEVAVVGGIMINRKGGGDFFQPLSFETRTQTGTTDLYEKAFGKRPDLIPALGSKGVATSIYGPKALESLSKSLRSELPAL